METPTIIKQTKRYLLVKIPLPRTEMQTSKLDQQHKKSPMNVAEKRLLRAIQESERDVRMGRVITAPNITEALRRYEKKQWD